jgi:putative ABC transport system substrate-binding protein
VKRREFITLVGGATAWPLAARAQQSIPLVGFLHVASPDGSAFRVGAFRQGLKEAGFAEGENVAIEYRWADNQADRLPLLAADLVRRRVAVICAVSIPAAFAAKAATTTLPIVFVATEDPVKLGLVANLARPQGNLTGINFFASELAAKRLELLLELVPGAARIAVLVEPSNSVATASTLRDMEAAARGTQIQIQTFNASSSDEIDAVFASFVRERPDALLLASTPFFTDRRVQLALLAALHRLPAIYPWRDFVEAGGLISYGASLGDTYRQLHRAHPQGLEAYRPACGAIDQVRAGYQPPDCKDSRSPSATDAACSCRRGD